MLHDDAKTRIRLSLAEARDYAAQYFGFPGSFELSFGEEIFEVLPKVFWTPEQQKAMAEVDEWLKTLDHDEVEVRNPITQEIVVHPETGKPLVDRVLVTPHRKNGRLVSPPFETRYLAALWGEEKAKRFEAAGGTYGLVTMLMAQMDDGFAQWRKNRERRDSKSE